MDDTGTSPFRTLSLCPGHPLPKVAGETEEEKMEEDQQIPTFYLSQFEVMNKYSAKDPTAVNLAPGISALKSPLHHISLSEDTAMLASRGETDGEDGSGVTHTPGPHSTQSQNEDPPRCNRGTLPPRQTASRGTSNALVRPMYRASSGSQLL
jgi:hypothetical protein